MPRSVVFAASVAAILSGSAGCAAPREVYSPDQLREEIARRAPAILRDEIVVPYELAPPRTAAARGLVQGAHTDAERVTILLAALFDPKVFALRYTERATASAEETLLHGEGNCLSLASVFIGLARAVGLDARYLDASSRVHETRYADDGIAVHFGHVTAVVLKQDGNVGLDFAQLGRFQTYRIIDDLEALAHFYNNRGFELIDAARERGDPVDWAAAEHQFRLAVQVKPAFARGWNNLGICAARQGRRAEAIADFLRAIAADPELAAPRANLGTAYLEASEPALALASLEAAARLDPDGAQLQYALALARLSGGDRAGAALALRRAIALRGRFPAAETLLRGLAPQAP